jgi:NADPH-dependent 2,4-dienoyl-CoA reductase/sulfur reductase-like enzyme
LTRTIPIRFEGREFLARTGESVASALAGNGVLAFRQTARGSERGIFCGMGVCQDCLLDIDGEPSRRACMTRVDRSMDIRRHRAAAPLPASAEPPPALTTADVPHERPELLVIGAGPGGISAAIAARSAGAQVLVIDERSAPGGQYFKPLAIDGERLAPADNQHREGLALVRRALDMGVEIRNDCMVWGAFAPNEFACSDGGGTVQFTPRATIVATGAYERAWPVPGWTLPGVMTTGAAQTLWRTARRLPAERVVIAGNGPLNLQLAAELAAGGAEIIALAESAPALGIASIPALVAMGGTAPRLLVDGLRYRATLLKRRVPVLNGMMVASISRHEGHLAIELAPVSGAGRRVRLDSDVLCIGYGFEPSNEILRALGCRHELDDVSGQLLTCRERYGATSVAGVYALGDCTGLGGARLAMAEGTLTGLAAANYIGHDIDDRKQRRAATAAARRHRRFQAALWRLYAARNDWRSFASNETIICRCEEISFGEVRAAIEIGISEAGAVKRQTRAGMGACQGRYCRPLIEACIADATGRRPSEYSGFAPRIPLKPIAIRDLAPLPRR